MLDLAKPGQLQSLCQELSLPAQPLGDITKALPPPHSPDEHCPVLQESGELRLSTSLSPFFPIAAGEVCGDG